MSTMHINFGHRIFSTFATKHRNKKVNLEFMMSLNRKI